MSKEEEKKKKPTAKSRSAKVTTTKKAVKPPASRTAVKTIARKSVIQAPTKPKAILYRAPSGYEQTATGQILVPEAKKPVPTGKIKNGIEKAQEAIKGMIDGFSKTLTEEYSIKEIEFSVSFSADGKFLGFGVGGETSITVKIAPT